MVELGTSKYVLATSGKRAALLISLILLIITLLCVTAISNMRFETQISVNHQLMALSFRAAENHLAIFTDPMLVSTNLAIPNVIDETTSTACKSR
jgi:hypothetical protein